MKHIRLASRERPRPRLRLLQPEPHVHFAAHRCREGEVYLRLLPLAHAPVEFAEAKVAVGDERAHAARLGEGQRVGVVDLAALGIEPVGMGRDVAEQVVSMGRVSGLMRRRLERALAEALRLGKPTEPQTSATERMVGPAMIVDESPRRLMVEELLAFPTSFRPNTSL